ncbi:CHC2 zinc finger domain-containing protein [Pelagibius sp.]|uniref:DUF7146 domain-containing protein n=1 Tax=Pelagibius sp. TaxID=1931238 RepID=UPI0026355098|nr:CHC2 zinc finger domain-containing protein [Pelagibius sp.]
MTRRGSQQFTDFFVREVRERTRIVHLIGRDVPLTRRGGRHWGLCPFHQEKTASFTVSEERGSYKCYGCGARGDAIDWLKDHHGLAFREAVAELAVQAGLIADREGRTLPRKPPVPRKSEEEASQDRARSIAWARSRFAESRPAAGTWVERYLRRRGITIPIPPTIRFHPGLKHKGTGLIFPAMVAAVQDGQGRITGIHRTFLQPGGLDKANVCDPKQMAGACWGGCVRLGPVERELPMGEGIETSLSVQQAIKRSCWAALSVGGMGAAVLPRKVEGVILCGERDVKDQAAYDAQIEGAARWHHDHGRWVRIAWPGEGQDFNDMHREQA